MVLTTQDPAQLTGQLNSVQNVMDMESATLDRLYASRILLTVKEETVEGCRLHVHHVLHRVQLAGELGGVLRSQHHGQAEQSRAAALVVLRRDLAECLFLPLNVLQAGGELTSG